MLERKVNVIEELNRTLAGMGEQEKSYLMENVRTGGERGRT